jgi:hypothetical protein
VAPPPPDDAVTPPADDVTPPPPDDAVTPPAADGGNATPPVECAPDTLTQSDAPQQLLSLQSLASAQSLSTGMRINTGQDDDAGLIVGQGGDCETPPPAECPADPEGSQQVLQLLRDADVASESSTAADAAAAPADNTQALAASQTRLSTGLRINAPSDDPAGLDPGAADQCAPTDGGGTDELQQANQDPQSILQLLR